MVFKLITFIVLVFSITAVCYAAPEGDNQDTGAEALGKMTELFGKFKDNFNSFMKNVSDTDTFKQIQKVGEELTAKGKELGGKLQDTIKNIGEKATAS